MVSACEFSYILKIVQLNTAFSVCAAHLFLLNWDRSGAYFVGHKHTSFYLATTSNTVPLPDLYFHWSLYTVAPIVDEAQFFRDDLNQCCYVLRCTKDTWMIQETLITLGWRQWLLIFMMTPGKFSANSNYRSVKKRVRVKYIN